MHEYQNGNKNAELKHTVVGLDKTNSRTSRDTFAWHPAAAQAGSQGSISAERRRVNQVTNTGLYERTQDSAENNLLCRPDKIISGLSCWPLFFFFSQCVNYQLSFMEIRFCLGGLRNTCFWTVRHRVFSKLSLLLLICWENAGGFFPKL